MMPARKWIHLASAGYEIHGVRLRHMRRPRTAKYRIAVRTRPEMIVPQSESSGFFIVILHRRSGDRRSCGDSSNFTMQVRARIEARATSRRARIPSCAVGRSRFRLGLYDTYDGNIINLLPGIARLGVPRAAAAVDPSNGSETQPTSMALFSKPPAKKPGAATWRRPAARGVVAGPAGAIAVGARGREPCGVARRSRRRSQASRAGR